MALCLACGTQSTPEPRAGWRFADGAWISKLHYDAANLRAGDHLTVRWTGSPLASQGLVWGLARVQDAGWQHYPRVQAPQYASEQTRWSAAKAGSTQIELQIPQNWQDRSVTLLAYRKKQGSLVPVLSGARLPSSDPPQAKAARVMVGGVLPLAPTLLPVQVAPAPAPVTIDGRDADWPASRPRHALVHSLTGERITTRTSQLRVMWTQDELLLFAELQDPDLWAPDKLRDDPLYRKEALEVFVGADGDTRDYLELQISAADVIFDAAHPRYRQQDRSFDGPWRHAVVRDGTLHRRKDKDKGWTAELALPWSMLCEKTRLRCPVGPGTRFRVNVFRVESLGSGAQIGTSLSAVYRPDFHAMDRAAVFTLWK